MNPTLALIIRHIRPARLPSLALLERLTAQPPTLDDLLAWQPQIEAGVNELDGMAHHTREMVNRCLRLPAITAPRPPAGF